MVSGRRLRGGPRHATRRGRRRVAAWSRAGAFLAVAGLVAVIAVLTNGLLHGALDNEATPGGPPPSAVPVLPRPSAAGVAPSTPAGALNRLTNPDFARDLNGWVPTTSTFAGWTAKGHDGDGAVALRANPRITPPPASTTEPASIGIMAEALTSTGAGQRVSASIWLRPSAPGASAVLRLVERGDGRVVGAGTASVALAGTGWRQVQVDYTTKAGRARIDLELHVSGLGEAAILVADDAAVEVEQT
jgi:hypothetical protein